SQKGIFTRLESTLADPSSAPKLSYNVLGVQQLHFPFTTEIGINGLVPQPPPPASSTIQQRVSKLEEEVQELRRSIVGLRGDVARSITDQSRLPPGCCPTRDAPDVGPATPAPQPHSCHTPPRRKREA
ncbi:hypothetical protein Tco_0981123, partial [Tanacetum coccineum]